MYLREKANRVSNVPIGGIALVTVMLFVKPKRTNEAMTVLSPIQRLKRMDWIGTIIFLGAFTCLFLALQWGGQTKPCGSSQVIGLFVGFGLLLGAFAYSQNFTGEDSLLPRRILKQRTVLFGTIYLILFGLQMAVVSPNSSSHRFTSRTNVISICNIYQYISRQFVALLLLIVGFE